jgi:hypothetical protein
MRRASPIPWLECSRFGTARGESVRVELTLLVKSMGWVTIPRLIEMKTDGAVSVA